MSLQYKSAFILLFGFATALVLSSSDLLALLSVGTLVVTSLVALALVCFSAALAGNIRCIQTIGVVAILLISTTLRFREYEDKSIDFQIIMKLGSITLMMLVVLLAYLTGQLRCNYTITKAWLALMSYFLLTSLYSETIAFSLVASISLLACGLFCFYLVQTLGGIRSVAVVILCAALICALSIFVFFAYPKLGKMHGWTGIEFGSLNRMRGVTPSANAIGSVAALGLLFSYFYSKQMRGLMWYVAVALVPLALVCLFFSNNRMSMAAIAITVVFAWLFRSQTLLKGWMLANVGVLGLCIFLIFPDQILTSLTRSGDPSEITSATGRSYIWAVVIEHIVTQPIFGYGYTSSMSVLPKDPRLFAAAMHAHNLYLEVLFSGGFIALALLIAALASTVRCAIRAKASKEAAIILFFLTKGFMEATPFSGIIAFNAFALFIVIAIVSEKDSQVRTVAYVLHRPI